MPTERQVIAVVQDTINAALPAAVRAYEPHEIPTTRPNEFVVLTIARRAGGNARAGRYETTGWSVYVMAVSRSSADNARVSLEKAGGVLEGRVLTVAGGTSTPVTFGNGRPVAPDDGWLTGVNTYEFSL